MVTKVTRLVDDLVVTRGNDDTGLNLRKIRDLTTLGRYVVAELATEVFSCAHVASSAWDGFAVQKYGNTTSDRDLDKIVFQDVILPSGCPACPNNLITSPDKWQIRSVQRSLGKIVGIEYNTEENDNMLEEIYATVYVKMINGKTISIRHHRNMTAAVISDEVESRSLIPRDMTRLVHQGTMISEKKTMKENNIKAKETIEMSLRLLGGMEVNEQMDTHETEEDRENKKA